MPRDDDEIKLAQAQGEIRRLAKSLLDIAACAMPDSYFATDSRVRFAKAMQTKYKKKRG